MRVVRPVAAVLALAAVVGVLIALGTDSGPERIDPDVFPLVPEAEVTASAEDPGVDHETAQKPERYLVVAGPRAWSDAQLKAAQVRLVTRRGWRLERGPTGRQVRARQPDGDVTAFVVTAREARRDDAGRRFLFGIPEELEPRVHRAERGPRPTLVVRLTRLAPPPGD